MGPAKTTPREFCTALSVRRRVAAGSLTAALGLAGICAIALLSVLWTDRLTRGVEPDEQPADARLALLRTFRQEFVPLASGEPGFPADFQMGRADGPATERPPHRVTIAKPFAIARYEVPQNLWQAVEGSNPSRWLGKRNSVEMVSYDDALRFCRRATELLRDAKLIEPGEIVRLPSEAEWEYAARAGTTTRYSFGDDAAKLDDHAWHNGNAAGNDPPVGAKQPNAWKLYDMHGYLWEWCADDWHDNYQGIQPTAAPGRTKSRNRRTSSAAVAGKTSPSCSLRPIVAVPPPTLRTTRSVCAACCRPRQGLIG